MSDLRITGSDVCLTEARHGFVVPGLHLLEALASAGGASYSIDAAGRLLCAVGDIAAPIEGLEDIWILHEIFVVGIYNLIDTVAATRHVVVWDIGMNVGLASLYFAARPQVVAVIGNEPIARTYRAALDRLQLNPAGARKITALNYGVGGSNRTELVDYCDAFRGSVGLYGLVGDVARRQIVLGIDEATTTISKEELPMRAAPDVLNAIRSAHPGLAVVAKIDCEGAEYEILAALAQSGQLHTLAAVMLEWHRDGPDQLVATLEAAGFAVNSVGRSDVAGQGMIYAVHHDG